MKKYDVMISLVRFSVLTDDILKDIQKAVEYTSHNLAFRYKIDITEPKRHDEYCAIVHVKTNNEKVSSDNLGRDLKGISMYLLTHWPDKYVYYRLGTKLLNLDVAISDAQTLIEEKR